MGQEIEELARDPSSSFGPTPSEAGKRGYGPSVAGRPEGSLLPLLPTGKKVCSEACGKG